MGTGIRAVIFDLDGTLLNTLEDIAASMNAALAANGFQTHPADAYRLLIGRGMMNLARAALPEDAREPAVVQKAAAAMRREYEKRWADKTRPYDGIPELLEKLCGAGIKTAVLSNKPDDFTRKCVGKFFPQYRFDAVLGEQPWIPKKPDPAAAFEIARQLGFSPAFFACLGDSDIDMQTAAAAGMLPLGALWGFRSAEELNEHGAQRLLDTPLDLIKLIAV
jgi:phosphoglycolate phosphatase